MKPKNIYSFSNIARCDEIIISFYFSTIIIYFFLWKLYNYTWYIIILLWFIAWVLTLIYYKLDKLWNHNTTINSHNKHLYFFTILPCTVYRKAKGRGGCRACKCFSRSTWIKKLGNRQGRKMQISHTQV